VTEADCARVHTCCSAPAIGPPERLLAPLSRTKVAGCRPRPLFDMELTMHTAWNPLSLSQPEPSLPQAHRDHRAPSLWRLIYETLVEAQATSRDARRRYPFIGS